MTRLTISFPPPQPVVLTGAPGLAVDIAGPQAVDLVQSPTLALEIAPPALVSLTASPPLVLTLPAPQPVTLQVQGIQGPPGTGGGGSAADSFETVSRNLSASNGIIAYSGGELSTITYANGITKTLGYGPDGLATVTLSGATPGGIALTKTLNYTLGELTGFTYS